MTFVNPSNLMALAVSFMDITFVLLLLRFVTIRMFDKAKRSIRADDIAVAATGLFTIAMCICMITGTAYGVLGRTLPITLEKGKPLVLAILSPQLQQTAQFAWSLQLMFVFQITLARLSIVLFYRRTLVPDPFGKLHWATLTVIGVLGVWLVGFFFAYLFQCGTQFSIIWTGPVLSQSKSCVNNNLDLAASATGVILDLIIVLLPMHRIMTLRLSPAQRIQIASAFMVGLLSVAGGTVRLAAISSVLLRVKNLFTTMDPALLSSTMAYWQVFEVGFAMTAAGLPALRPFVNHVVGVVDSTFSSKLRSTKNKSSRNDSDAVSFAEDGNPVKMTIHKGQMQKV